MGANMTRWKSPVFLDGVQKSASAQVPDHLEVPDCAEVWQAPELPQLLEEGFPAHFVFCLPVLTTLSLLPQIAGLLCNLQRLNVKEQLRVALVHDTTRFGLVIP